MSKLSTSSLSAIAAVALTVAAAAPSFAWGWGWNNGPSEVANRDAMLQNEIANDAGRLRGQYNNLSVQDRMIRHQEKRELAQNGGFLTNGQVRQLNAEESNLQRQINYNNRYW